MRNSDCYFYMKFPKYWQEFCELVRENFFEFGLLLIELLFYHQDILKLLNSFSNQLDLCFEIIIGDFLFSLDLSYHFIL